MGGVPHADGFGYSWFCDLYKGWVGRLKPTLRQIHVAGEKLFVDFAGRTAEVIDGLSGEIVTVQIFLATLGALSFTYAEAVWSQALPDCIAAHVRAFAYFDGAARQTVSDNLKAGITKACFYEPMVNRTYADMARHYGTAIVPARPYRPRDKAKVEVAVQVIGRWILARLRHRQFFSLTELNRAIRALLDELNYRPMRGWGVSRRALYQQLDQPALVRLPAVPYEYAEWKRCRVGLDYHVEIAKHYYSVPHPLLRQEVEARITAATVEIFHRGKRVASHRRSLLPHRPSTVAEHMPSAHRRYRDWTHERIAARPRGSVPIPPCSSMSSCAPGRIRSRGSAPVSGSSAWSSLRRRSRRDRLRPRTGARHPLFSSSPRSSNARTAPNSVRPIPLLIHETSAPATTLPYEGDPMLIHPPRALARLACPDADPLSSSTYADAAELSPRLLAARRSRAPAVRHARRPARAAAQSLPSRLDLRAPGLDRALFLQLSPAWLRDHPIWWWSGRPHRKSWLACALGHKACREGFSVLSSARRGCSAILPSPRRRPAASSVDHARAHLSADHRRLGTRAARQPTASHLLEIVDDRYDKGSLLITSQVPVSGWHEVIGNPTLGDAILDRIVHRAHRLDLRGK